MSLHKKLPVPESPGDWVDEHQCICGEQYKNFKSKARFPEAVGLVRAHNGGDWWPSRGPVLWAMRTMKLDEWYWRHRLCCRGE